MSVIALLLLLTPQAIHAASGMLGVCVFHDVAFPNGPDAADLSQTLCHLVEETTVALPCNDLTEMTGQEFMETVYIGEQAQFCEDNAALVAGVSDRSNPDSVLILETMVMESLAVLDAQAEKGQRRELFVDELIGAAEEGLTWMWEVNPVFCIFVCAFGIALLATAILVYMAGGGGRRALAAPPADAASTNALISANDIISECANNSASFLCQLPVMELLGLFATGICANTLGLQCVLTQESLLALQASITD